MNTELNGAFCDRSGEAFARDLAARLVDAAKRAGADSADATVGLSTSVEAKARDGEVEDLGHSSSRACGLRVIVDGKLGFVTAADVPQSAADVDELAQNAVSLARISTPSEHNVLPDVSGEMIEAGTALRALLPETAALTVDWAIAKSLEMERVLSAVDGISTVDDVGASVGTSAFALATSSGFLGSRSGAAASLYAGAVAMDADNKRQTAMWWDSRRDVRDLDAAELIAQKAAERALAKRGGRKLESTRAPVIFEPSMARTFIGAMLAAINADAVNRGASFLAGKHGEPVWVPGAAIVDDPTRVGAMGSRAFDGEGLPTARTTLFDADGKLSTYLTDARSAHQMGVAPGGHASRGASGLPRAGTSNIVLEGGTGDLASIIAETERGLLVTSLMGHSPDQITGEYSRGAAGFWIENGAIAYPVEEITIAGHMLDMMRGIDRIGADPEPRSSVGAPTLRFAELAISGA